jgi:hypothetical protein
MHSTETERGREGLPGPGRVKSGCSQELHAELTPCQTAYILSFFTVKVKINYFLPIKNMHDCYVVKKIKIIFHQLKTCVIVI